MSSEVLVLKPDPIKSRFVGVILPAIVVMAIWIVLVTIFREFDLGIFAYLVVAAIVCAVLLNFWINRHRNCHVELHREGLLIVSETGQHVQKWADMARITLLEKISRDENGEISVGSHYLAIRRLRGGKDDADEATDEIRADTLIPIDLYISHHRYSGRTQAQEDACKSAQDLADTVNAWRDFALDLEIGAVPTPVLQKEHLRGDLDLKIYARPV